MLEKLETLLPAWNSPDTSKSRNDMQIKIIRGRWQRRILLYQINFCRKERSGSSPRVTANYYQWISSILFLVWQLNLINTLYEGGESLDKGSVTPIKTTNDNLHWANHTVILTFIAHWKLNRRLVSSVGRAPVCCAGDWGLAPQTGPTVRVLK